MFSQLGFFCKKYMIFIGIFVPFLLIACIPSSQERYSIQITRVIPRDLVVRAAIDIGSGATKLRVAEINLKTKKIERILVNESFTVPYQEELSKSPNHTFDAKVMQVGLNSLKQSLEIAKKYHAEKTIAVATAAFRKANNADEFIATIKQETGIPVYVIDQDLEGKLSYEAAAEQVDNPAEMIVWDIGGGSLQLTMKDANGNYQIYRGHEASVPFKNYIIQNIQKRSLEQYRTPNPMTKDEIQSSISHAREIASKVDQVFKDRIQDPNVRIIGVGNVFAYGISLTQQSAFIQPRRIVH